MENCCNISISYVFHEIHKIFINNVKQEAEMNGINPTYRYIFIALSNNLNGLTQVEICNLIHLKAPSVSLLLQQMESEKLIIREKSNKDSRQTIVKITKKGLELDNKLKEIFKKHENLISDSLNEDELNNLKVYLKKIKDNLKGGNNNV